MKYGTIKEDLEALTGEADLARAVFLFHTPPHETKLDRAALDGKMVDHVPLDLHVGSIAVRRFIEARHPLLTLHGHIHESPRLDRVMEGPDRADPHVRRGPRRAGAGPGRSSIWRSWKRPLGSFYDGPRGDTFARPPQALSTAFPMASRRAGSVTAPIFTA